MIKDDRIIQEQLPAPPAERSGTDQERKWVAAGIIVTLAAVGCGIYWLWRLLAGREDAGDQVATQNESYPQSITDIAIPGMLSGDITLVADPNVTGVAITRTLHWDGDTPGSRPVAQESWTGTTLTIGRGCPAAPDDDACAIDYLVRLPASVAASIDTVSGNVSVTGLAAQVKIRTKTGDIRLSNLAASVDMQTMSGDIVADHLDSKTLLAHTASGDIAASFASIPDTVTITGTNSDVQVTVPSAGRYALDAQTLSGDRNISVPDDPDSRQAVSVRLISGDIDVAGD